MVAPSALAETVTPASFSPAADVIDPLSSASAACADNGMNAVAANPAAATAAKVKRFARKLLAALLLAALLFVWLMSFSLGMRRSAQRAAGAGVGAGTVLRYATMALIWVG